MLDISGHGMSHIDIDSARIDAQPPLQIAYILQINVLAGSIVRICDENLEMSRSMSQLAMDMRTIGGCLNPEHQHDLLR
jgi:hypothetical protein